MNSDKEEEKMIHDAARRQFLRAATLTAGAAGALSVSRLASAQSAAKSRGLSLSMAGYRFNRVDALVDGRVKVKGCEIRFEETGIGDANTHVFNGPQTRDVTEIGLHPFMLTYANDGFQDYSLLPIFPLRLFRHKSIFIRTDRGIKKPEDLRGKTIATAA